MPVVIGRVMAKAAIRPAMETVIGDTVTLQPVEIEPDVIRGALLVYARKFLGARQPQQLVA
jgi:hypothetical protein